MAACLRTPEGGTVDMACRWSEGGRASKPHILQPDRDLLWPAARPHAAAPAADGVLGCPGNVTFTYGAPTLPDLLVARVSGFGQAPWSVGPTMEVAGVTYDLLGAVTHNGAHFTGVVPLVDDGAGAAAALPTRWLYHDAYMHDAAHRFQSRWHTATNLPAAGTGHDGNKPCRAWYLRRPAAVA